MGTLLRITELRRIESAVGFPEGGMRTRERSVMQCKRIAHTYKVGDKVLFKENEENKYDNNLYSGPHLIRKVHPNGTVVVKMGSVLEAINNYLIKPFKN